MNTCHFQNLLADYVVARWVMPSVFFVTALMHFIWALAIQVSEAPLHTTGIENIYLVTGHSWLATEIIFMTGAILGFAFCLRHGIKAAIALSVQQFLLTLSAMQAIREIISGKFADGVHYPHWFITADQSALIALCLLHCFSVVALYVSVAIRRRRLPEGTLQLPRRMRLEETLKEPRGGSGSGPWAVTGC